MVLRRTAFCLITVALLYAIVEVAAFAVYWARSGVMFSFDTLQQERSAIRSDPADTATPTPAGERPPQALISKESLHPFLGYVLDPTRASAPRINDYGFLGTLPPLGPPPPDVAVVAVFGGSFAAETAGAGGGILAQELQGMAAWPGRSVQVCNLALPGMKQPQQLMILAYFLSLGAHFDLVINLDGFNEIVLPITDNMRHGTFPFYPRAWKQRVAGIVAPDLVLQAGQIAYLERRREELALAFSNAPQRFSVAANLTWYLQEEGLRRRLAALRTNLIEQTLRAGDPGGELPYSVTGPERTYASNPDRFADLAQYWERCSAVFENLARAHGIPAFHFLQPNQYVPDSKVFTDAERIVALPGDHPYAAAATAGYPHLIRAGRRLTQAGVRYVDLTMVFAGNDEVLYADGCCHLNRRGYQLVAREIGRIIREQLDAEG